MFDCFMYFDEDIVLDVRLNTLHENVDYFVIVEGNKTWQNNNKNFRFNINNFSKFKDKIIYIIVDRLPENLHDTSKIQSKVEKGNRIIDNTLMIEHNQK